MVKAEDFLKYLCGVMEYRFVSGLSSVELKPIYDNLNPEILHYIPAVSEEAALGMVTGVSIGNIKGIVFFSEDQFERIKYKFKNINIDNELPAMIIIIGNSDYKTNVKGLKCFKIKHNFIFTLRKADSYIQKEGLPCIVLLDKEFLV